MDQEIELADEILLANDFIGKKVFSKEEGVEIGTVRDLMIDPNLLEVAAIVTDEEKTLKRKIRLVPTIGITAWGQDAIMVSKADVLRTKDEIPEFKHWLSVPDQLIGQDVVSTDGTRLGNLKNIFIDENGRIVKYELHLEENNNPSRYEGKTIVIPSVATHSIGSEVLMVNTNDIA